MLNYRTAEKVTFSAVSLKKTPLMHGKCYRFTVYELFTFMFSFEDRFAVTR